MTRLSWFLCSLALAAVVVSAATGQMHLFGPSLIALLALLALAFMGQRPLRSFAFTIWVFTFVAASLVYPRAFGTWFGVDLAILIVPLIQIIMFGMGTTLSVADFTRVLRMPWPVFIGILLQYSVMPVAGYLIAGQLGFEPEIAAGVVLIGSCPGGVASNLMTYIARADVALSVTMTSCSTLLSPLMTPLLMTMLASQYVAIDFLDMMLKICNMIIVPIIAGLIANRILYSRAAWSQGTLPLATVAVIGLGVAILAAWLDVALFGALKGGVVVGAAMIGVIALAKLVIGVLLSGPENWMDRTLPIVSMAGICYIIAIITARSSEELLSVGPLLIAASILHNFVGYLFGYWCARLSRLDERSCRTVAFEVGMQNGGMASGLAMTALHSAKAALAPAIFGPWMNVSGSVLATWWHRKPVPGSEIAAAESKT